jgi:hypothetical protein
MFQLSTPTGKQSGDQGAFRGNDNQQRQPAGTLRVKFRQPNCLGPDIEGNVTRWCGHGIKLLKSQFPNPEPNFNTQMLAEAVSKSGGAPPTASRGKGMLELTTTVI